MSSPTDPGHTAPLPGRGGRGGNLGPGLDWQAVVLCGGRARRFGADKVMAELHGRPLLGHILASCEPARQLWLLGPSRRLPLPPTARWVPDPVPNAGPLSALVALGLAGLAGPTLPTDPVQHGAGAVPWTAVLAGDMPLVDRVLGQLLAHAADGQESVPPDGYGCRMVDRHGAAAVAPVPVLLRTEVLLRRARELAPEAQAAPLRRLLDGLDVRTVAEQPGDVDAVRDLEVLEQQPE